MHLLFLLEAVKRYRSLSLDCFISGWPFGGVVDVEEFRSFVCHHVLGTGNLLRGFKRISAHLMMGGAEMSRILLCRRIFEQGCKSNQLRTPSWDALWPLRRPLITFLNHYIWFNLFWFHERPKTELPTFVGLSVASFGPSPSRIL